MDEKTKKAITTGSIIAIALGCVGLYVGGGSESYAQEIVGSVFMIIGIVLGILKK